MKTIISDEELNAFTDRELAAEEHNAMFDAFEQDASLKERACELHNLKKMIQHAYPTSGKTTKPMQLMPTQWRPIISRCLAASLALLVFGATAGHMIPVDASPHTYPKVTRLIKTIQSNNIGAEPDKIIVQVSNSNPVRLKAALDESENLLNTYQQTQRPLDLEIIANGGGLDLLRKGVSPYETRVMHMQKQYQNLHFYACNISIDNLKKHGVSVNLLPNTGIATSALDEINKRVRQGWDYVRV